MLFGWHSGQFCSFSLRQRMCIIKNYYEGEKYDRDGRLRGEWMSCVLRKAMAKVEVLMLKEGGNC